MINPGTPYEHAALRDALTRVTREGLQALAGLDDAAFFRPQGEYWSPAEHVRHLRKSAAPLGTALRLPKLVLRLRFGRRTAGSRSFTDLRQAYLALLAAGGRAGRFTPSAEPLPADPSRRRAEILRAWEDASLGVVAASRSWNESQLDRHQGPHPLLGLLSVRELLMFTVLHTAHHLNRIEERR